VADSLLRVGSRGSALALCQSREVIRRLTGLHPQLRCQKVTIGTRGDVLHDVALSQVGGKGLFVKELEQALLAGEIDLAVHGLKDLPGQPTAGLRLAAITERQDPRDVLISPLRRPLADLPAGNRVGTSSLRRAAQLLALRPDLRIVNLRGNVETRLRKAADGDCEAVILAAAGLIRLGLADQITEYLPPERMLPAAGQGALAVQVRTDDEATRAWVAPLDHRPTRVATEAERAFLARLGGGCRVPIAAYGLAEENKLWLRGLVSSPDGCHVVRGERRGPTARAEAIGQGLAEELLEQGAGALVEAFQS
jgi:hydroxymethylbilane synthase